MAECTNCAFIMLLVSIVFGIDYYILTTGYCIRATGRLIARRIGYVADSSRVINRILIEPSSWERYARNVIFTMVGCMVSHFIQLKGTYNIFLNTYSYS